MGTDPHGYRRHVLDPLLPAFCFPARHAILARDRRARPSVTIDLGPIFAGGRAQFAAGPDAINSLALVALTRVLGPDTSVVVLDWQHQTYRFWPHLFACQSDQQWPTTVFPNGDYYIFLTEDMNTGTFGHPGSRRSVSSASHWCPPWYRLS